MALVAVQLQPHAFDGGAHRGSIETMAFDDVVDSLLHDDARRLVHRVQHVRGLGVMVEMAGTPVIEDLRQVEIVAADAFRGDFLRAVRHAGFNALALFHHGHCSVGNGDGRHAGRSAEAFLHAGRGDVDAPFVHSEVVADH